VKIAQNQQKPLGIITMTTFLCFFSIYPLVTGTASSICSDGDFGKYFHLPVPVHFGKWILFTCKLPVNKKKSINTMKKLKIRFINGLLMQNKVETLIECF
jgi:hypothetical protein